MKLSMLKNSNPLPVILVALAIGGALLIPTTKAETMIDVTTSNARDPMMANPDTKTVDENGTVFMKVSGVMRNERTGSADGISLTTLGYNCSKKVFYASDGLTMLNLKNEVILNQPHTKFLAFPAKGKLVYKHQSNFYKGFCPHLSH